MPFAEFAHIEADEGAVAPEKLRRDGLREESLPHAGRTEEEKGCNRSIGIADTRGRTDERARDGVGRFFLPDDGFRESGRDACHGTMLMFEGEFAFGNAGRAGERAKHICFGDERAIFFLRGEVFVFQDGDRPSGLLFFVIEFARGIIGFFFECLIFFSDKTLESFAQYGEVFVGNDSLFASVFHCGGCFIDEVEGLVREESIMDMPYGCIECEGDDRIRERDFMECFECVFGLEEDGERFIS